MEKDSLNVLQLFLQIVAYAIDGEGTEFLSFSPITWQITEEIVTSKIFNPETLKLYVILSVLNQRKWYI